MSHPSAHPTCADAPSARWERIRALFHVVLELEPEAAQDTLAREPDRALAQEVTRLLDDAALAAARGLFAAPTLGTAVAPPSDPEERAGSLIGPYRLVEVVGEGGFGIVYRAQQLEPVKREVAVKIIKLGMDTRQVLRRFEAERQTLAMMDHPGIARVLDAGVTGSGRPFFVMELVAGVPITEHCDALRLDVADRLRLMVQVCVAIQHAHQKGVIHRDIKPSNVLVASAGGGPPVAKVIDFGIAKATGSELSERTLLTEFRQLVGTPEYMSPEQAGLPTLDIDTRSDVYSLGVLLYELLTGMTPVDPRRLRSGGPAEMQRVIVDEPAPWPSVRVALAARHGDGAAAVEHLAARRRLSPTALVRRLQGDLDWIVGKAIEKDRARRYATAVELAADLERHLRELPVEARPPSATYRVRKFVRRNRVAVAATAAIAALSTVTAVAAANLVGEWERTQELESRLAAEQARAGDDLDPLEDRLVMARLATARVRDNFNGARFEDVVAAIAAQAGVKHRIDWSALEAVGVSRDSGVSIELDGLRADAALDAAFGQVANDPLGRPQRTVADGQLVVTTLPILARDRMVAVYDVADLGEAERIAELVRALVHPEGWIDNGGNAGTIALLGSSLVVQAPRDDQRAIRALLDTLRRPAAAAGPDGTAAATTDPIGDGRAALPADSAADEKAARRLAESRLDVRWRDASLEDAIEAIRVASGVSVSVDWGALGAMGIVPDARVDLRADGLPAAAALHMALSQASAASGTQGDSARSEIVDGALVISSESRLGGLRRTLTFDLTPLGWASVLHEEDGKQWRGWDEIAQLITEMVDQENWIDNGGVNGALYVLGDRLIVQATPRVQSQVRDLLASLAAPGRRVDATPSPDLDAGLATLAQLAAARVTIPVDTSAEVAVELAARSAGLALAVEWSELERHGADRSTVLTDGLVDVSALAAIEAALAVAKGQQDWPPVVDVRDGTVVIARPSGGRGPVAVFDVSPLLGGLVTAEGGATPAQQVAQTVMSVVEPDRWTDNGGTEAKMNALGDRLVVQASTPMLRAVQDVLEKLGSPRRP